jgi:hypothetical protein
MGREIRRVPPGWGHPRDDRGRFIPLFDGARYEEDLIEWQVSAAEARRCGDDVVEWCGKAPDPEDYTPVWSSAEAMAFCVYENVSEGTPWSPVFSEPEMIAAWLVNECGWSHEMAVKLCIDGWLITSDAIRATA